MVEENLLVRIETSVNKEDTKLINILKSYYRITQKSEDKTFFVKVISFNRILSQVKSKNVFLSTKWNFLG